MPRRILVAHDLTRGTVVGSRIEDAGSFWARFMGLMGRASLAPGAGMWIPGNGIHMLFMRFPIDCIFLSRPRADGQASAEPLVGRVVAIRHALPAWRGIVWYVREAYGVLELPVGAIDAAGVALGDEVALEIAGD